MSSLLQHAKSELRRAGLFDPDADYDGDVAVQVMALMETFCAYDHSGGSAEETVNLFKLLVQHLPLTPLTGEDDEWDEANGSPLWRNNRCSNVFKDETRAWIVLDGANAPLLGDGPVKYITFPFMVE
jgi:hypothetical protein